MAGPEEVTRRCSMKWLSWKILVNLQRNPILRKKVSIGVGILKILQKFLEQLFYRPPVNNEFVDHEIKFGKFLMLCRSWNKICSIFDAMDIYWANDNLMKLFFSRELDTFRKERARIRKENEEKKIKELVWQDVYIFGSWYYSAVLRCFMK